MNARDQLLITIGEKVYKDSIFDSTNEMREFRNLLDNFTCEAQSNDDEEEEDEDEDWGSEVDECKVATDVEKLIRALKRYDSLETVITELEAFDRGHLEVTVEDLAEYLNDEADYANE